MAAAAVTSLNIPNDLLTFLLPFVAQGRPVPSAAAADEADRDNDDGDSEVRQSKDRDSLRSLACFLRVNRRWCATTTAAPILHLQAAGQVLLTVPQRFGSAMQRHLTALDCRSQVGMQLREDQWADLARALPSLRVLRAEVWTSSDEYAAFKQLRVLHLNVAPQRDSGASSFRLQRHVQMIGQLVQLEQLTCVARMRKEYVHAVSFDSWSALSRLHTLEVHFYMHWSPSVTAEPPSSFVAAVRSMPSLTSLSINSTSHLPPELLEELLAPGAELSSTLRELNFQGTWMQPAHLPSLRALTNLTALELGSGSQQPWLQDDADVRSFLADPEELLSALVEGCAPHLRRLKMKSAEAGMPEAMHIIRLLPHCAALEELTLDKLTCDEEHFLSLIASLPLTLRRLHLTLLLASRCDARPLLHRCLLMPHLKSLHISADLHAGSAADADLATQFAALKEACTAMLRKQRIELPLLRSFRMEGPGKEWCLTWSSTV